MCTNDRKWKMQMLLKTPLLSGTDLYISKTENRICNTQIVRIFMWVIRGQWYNAI
jgi:hypothetical protein